MKDDYLDPSKLSALQIALNFFHQLIFCPDF